MYKNPLSTPRLNPSSSYLTAYIGSIRFTKRMSLTLTQFIGGKARQEVDRSVNSVNHIVSEFILLKFTIIIFLLKPFSHRFPNFQVTVTTIQDKHCFTGYHHCFFLEATNAELYSIPSFIGTGSLVFFGNGFPGSIV